MNNVTNKNVLHDMIVYRFLQLTMVFLEFSFERNPDLISLCRMNDTDEELTLVELTSEVDGTVQFIYLPRGNYFLARYSVNSFQAEVLFQYNFERSDIQMGTLNYFEGDETMALAWAEKFLNEMEDIFFKEG